MPPAAKATKRKAPAFKPPRPAAASSSRRPSAPSRPSDLAAPSSDDGTLPRASTSRVSAAAELEPDEPPPATVPPELLTRLVHHHLRDGGVTIDTRARALAAKYVETFVREALARARYEKDHAADGGARVFLEVRVDGRGLGGESKRGLTERCRSRTWRSWRRSSSWTSERTECFEWNTRAGPGRDGPSAPQITVTPDPCNRPAFTSGIGGLSRTDRL